MRLNAARWFDGTPRLQALQDQYHADVEHLGLERGLKGSKAKHKPVRRAYAEYAGEIASAKQLRIDAELDRSAAALERELAAKERAEAIEARNRALASEKSSLVAQERSEGLLRGAQAIRSGAILDGIHMPLAKRDFSGEETYLTTMRT